MKPQTPRTLIALALGAALGAGSQFALAQTGSITTTATATATAPAAGSTTGGTTAASTRSTSGVPSDKLVASFTSFAGSTENASALVTGLRTATPITLNSPTGATPGSAITFTPPTKPMGYGNIRIALSLARAELASQGITQPTPQQLEAALMGGSLTTGTGATAQTSQVQGVLQMRADGMGWGKIANSMGFKLGAVMSGRVPASAPVAGTGATTSASGTTAASGTTTASGKTTASGSGVTTGAGASAGHGKGTGIVTATGGGSGIVNAGGGGAGSVSTGFGGGHAAAAASGTVSAQGAAHGTGAGAGGQGKGGGKP